MFEKKSLSSGLMATAKGGTDMRRRDFLMLGGAAALGSASVHAAEATLATGRLCARAYAGGVGAHSALAKNLAKRQDLAMVAPAIRKGS